MQQTVNFKLSNPNSPRGWFPNEFTVKDLGRVVITENYDVVPLNQYNFKSGKWKDVKKLERQISQGEVVPFTYDDTPHAANDGRLKDEHSNNILQTIRAWTAHKPVFRDIDDRETQGSVFTYEIKNERYLNKTKNIHINIEAALLLKGMSYQQRINAAYDLAPGIKPHEKSNAELYVLLGDFATGIIYTTPPYNKGGSTAQYFVDTFSDLSEDTVMKIVINKALKLKQSDNTTILQERNGFIYIDTQPIGKNVEEAVLYFKKHDDEYNNIVKRKVDILDNLLPDDLVQMEAVKEQLEIVYEGMDEQRVRQVAYDKGYKPAFNNAKIETVIKFLEEQRNKTGNSIQEKKPMKEFSLND